VLNLDLQPGDLTLTEQLRADELVKIKYDHPSLNEKL
jgi:hypothetical protein